MLEMHCMKQQRDTAVSGWSQVAHVAEWRAALWRICHGGPGSVAAAPPAVDLEALAFVALRLQRALATLVGQLPESAFDPQGGGASCHDFLADSVACGFCFACPRLALLYITHLGTRFHTTTGVNIVGVGGPRFDAKSLFCSANGRPGTACAGVIARIAGFGSRTPAAAADVAGRWPPAAACYPGAVPAAAAAAFCCGVLGVSRHTSVSFVVTMYSGS